MNEYKSKTKAELIKELEQTRSALRVFQTNRLGGKAKNVKEGKTLRKTIARILTAVNAQ